MKDNNFRPDNCFLITVIYKPPLVCTASQQKGSNLGGYESATFSTLNKLIQFLLQRSQFSDQALDVEA